MQTLQIIQHLVFSGTGRWKLACGPALLYVFTASGFHSHAGPQVAYVGRYAYLPEGLEPNDERKHRDAHHTGTTLLALSTTDGEHWSDPAPLGRPTIFNTPPVRLASGRLLAAGGFIFPYTDDPAGLSGWKLGGLIPPSMRGQPVDDSETIWRLKTEFNLPVPTLCEDSFFQTADGVIHMQLRTNSERSGRRRAPTTARHGRRRSPPSSRATSPSSTSAVCPTAVSTTLAAPIRHLPGRARRWCCHFRRTPCVSTGISSSETRPHTTGRSWRECTKAAATVTPAR